MSSVADDIRRLKYRIDGRMNLKEFGARCDGATDDLGVLQALAGSGITTTVVVSGPCVVSANVTLPASLPVVFEANGSFTGPGTVTYTPWAPPPKSIGLAQLTGVETANGAWANGVTDWWNTGALPSFWRRGQMAGIETMAKVPNPIPTAWTAGWLTIPVGYRPTVSTALTVIGQGGAYCFYAYSDGRMIYADQPSATSCVIGQWIHFFGTWSL